jgi:tetraacyldisaccharide 4'-kinase
LDSRKAELQHATLARINRLLDAASFRDLISSRRRGWLASLIRQLLAVASWLYTPIIRGRNAWYDGRFAGVKRVDVPVVSVGNLTLGGTGKTPLVAWLVRWFQSRGVRVAIVSRGYKARAGTPNDEALELAGQLPGAPHVQNPQRVEGARQAIREHQAELIVLDDAFQHRRIHRDLNIVLLDALEPYGLERVFPRGLLREPLCGLKRADVVVLSRSDAVSGGDREAIRRRVADLAPHALWLEAVQRPCGLRSAEGRREDLGRIVGRRVAAFCGIGNPEGFRHTLRTCDCQLVDFREFPDHHAYSAEDVESLCRGADGLPDVVAVVCTHKDLVKIPRLQLGAVPLWALVIELEITVGGEEFGAKLATLLPKLGSDVQNSIFAGDCPAVRRTSLR